MIRAQIWTGGVIFCKGGDRCWRFWKWQKTGNEFVHGVLGLAHGPIPGAIPVMHVQAMTQEETMHARRSMSEGSFPQQLTRYESSVYCNKSDHIFLMLSRSKSTVVCSHFFGRIGAPVVMTTFVQQFNSLVLAPKYLNEKTI